MPMTNQEPSSSFNKGWTYDVFVSFHGEDTRYSFTGNLCNALDQKGIHIFKDDTKLIKGEEISPSLLNAIEESRIAIIVFSENYASSTWCLDELVKIIECMKEKGQLVRPVFYYVNPSDVRHQRRSFGRSMADHAAKLNNNKQRLLNWRAALSEAANLSGWHFKNGYEFEFIQRITEEISSKLNHTFLHIADYPVGLKYRMLEVMSRLGIKSNDDIRMLGIHGIGGIGKTTIARAVYNSIANQFEGSSFLADVREISKQHGLVQLQETLLSDLLGEKSIKLGDVSKGIPIIKKRLCRKKVLLILDDVDNLHQLRSLAGRQDWFGSGSRIIITTRNKHLLTTHGVEKLYEVKELNDHEALELFSWNAFKRREPDASYADIANRVVQYAKGLPLAMNIIGSDLFGKTIEEWTSALKKYERIPSKEILDVLKVSYDNLDDNEKEIFLDIACFFKGNLVEDVEKTLDASRFYSKYGIGVLIDKSLVIIDEINRLKMHDLIQDLGRDIARKDSPFDPGKRRRLWHYEDVLEVLTKNTGTDSIEGIILDMPNLTQEVQFRANAFKRMKRLRVLIVRNAQVSVAPKHLPNYLRFLEWNEYPSSLPADFHPETLVVLNLPQSHLTVDKPFKKFEHLTLMNLNECDSITKIPDVSATQNLAKILANNCPNLVEIDDSIGHLGKLVVLSTEGCPKLKDFPCAMRSTSLESLNLGKCSSIQSFPDILAEMGNMRSIDIEGTAIKKFPSSIQKIHGLEELVLTSCTSLEDLPSNIDMFQNIEELDVKGCPQLAKLLGKSLVDQTKLTDWLPKLNRLTLTNCDLLDDDLESIISNFPKLKWLVLSNNNFLTTIPEGIEDLSDLLFLHLDNCKQLRKIFDVPPYLQYIDARNCMSLTPQSADVLLSQAFQEVEYIDIVVPRTKVPKWLDHCSKGESMSFWVRRKLPAIAVLFLLGGENETSTNVACEFFLLINGLQVYQGERGWPVDHVWLFDIRLEFSAKEWLGLNEHLHPNWNQVEIKCIITNRQQNVTVKCCGIHLYKERIDIHNVSFVSPDLPNSEMAYDNTNDLDIYDEESEDVVFPQVLAKYFDRWIVELMESLQHRKKRDDAGYGNDDHLELDIDTTDSEKEHHLTSTSYQNPESGEVGSQNKGKGVAYNNMPEEKQSGDRLSLDPILLEDFIATTNDKYVKSSKLFVSASGGAEQQPLVASINGKELMIQTKGNLKEDGYLVPSSTAVASPRTNRGEQGKGPLYAQVSEDIVLTKSKQNSTKSNAEAKIPLNENQAETSHPQFQQSKANQESVAIEAEGGLIPMELFPNRMESTVIEDDMEVFYASLEAETPTLSLLQDTQTNMVSVSSSPSEETQKALQILRDFVSKRFSLLLNPGRSVLMKGILEYLVNLSPDEGISLRTKSVIKQLSRSFTQWSLDYNNASLKLESAAADLSKVDELKEGLEANVKEFREVETLEHGICSELDYLQERKRELEEQINAIKAEIADFTLARETVAKRKRKVFDNARMLRDQRDDLWNRAPSLRAEQEWAKITQANIENEWSKLGEQFIEST